MKKLYLKILLVLLIFFLFFAAAEYFHHQAALNTSIKTGFSPKDAAEAGAQFWIHLLAVLAFGVLLFIFLQMVFLRPLAEVRRILAAGPQPGDYADLVLPYRATFREIREILSGIDDLRGRIRKKSEEMEETREYLETLMRMAQVMVVKFDPQFHPVFANEYGIRKLQMTKEDLGHFKINDLMDKPFTQQMSMEPERYGEPGQSGDGVHVAERRKDGC